MKKVFAVFMLLCFLICLTPIRTVKADSFPSEFFVNSEVYYSAEELFNAYIDLNIYQEDIAAYLLGMYNLMYLGSRGYSFRESAYNNESSFIAKVKSLGYRLFQGAAEISLRSRFDADFCKYASACILYASQCNGVTFDTWYENLDQDFILPVDQGILNSFTLLYNDNSVDGISNAGNQVTPWDSGIVYSFAYNGYAWANSSYRNAYNNFIGSHDPIIYSKQSSTASYNWQIVSSLQGVTYPTNLYIVRSSGVYSTYQFGYDDFAHHHMKINSNVNLDSIVVSVQDNKLYTSGEGTHAFIKGGQLSTTGFSDLSDFIYYIFEHTIIVQGNGWGDTIFIGGYPFIGHVFLVDDLANLTNIEEIYNVSSYEIIGGNNNMVVPIDKIGTKPKVIVSIKAQETHNIKDMFDEDSVINDSGNPEDPWDVVTVVQPNDTNPISIDVNLFSSAKVYIQYLWNNATNFLLYCKDLLDCFSFEDDSGNSYGPKFAIYGVIVLGVSSGLIAKFLL